MPAIPRGSYGCQVEVVVDDRDEASAGVEVHSVVWEDGQLEHGDECRRIAEDVVNGAGVAEAQVDDQLLM